MTNMDNKGKMKKKERKRTIMIKIAASTVVSSDLPDTALTVPILLNYSPLHCKKNPMKG